MLLGELGELDELIRGKQPDVSGDNVTEAEAEERRAEAKKKQLEKQLLGQIEGAVLGQFAAEIKVTMTPSGVAQVVFTITPNEAGVAINTFFLPEKLNGLFAEYVVKINGNVTHLQFHSRSVDQHVSFEISGSVEGAIDIAGNGKEAIVDGKVGQAVNARDGATVIARSAIQREVYVRSGAQVFILGSVEAASVSDGSAIYAPSIKELDQSEGAVFLTNAGVNEQPGAFSVSNEKVEANKFEGDRERFLPTETEPIKVWQFDSPVPLPGTSTFLVGRVKIIRAKNSLDKAAYLFMFKSPSGALISAKIIPADRESALDRFVMQVAPFSTEPAIDDF